MPSTRLLFSAILLTALLTGCGAGSKGSSSIAAFQPPPPPPESSHTDTRTAVQELTTRFLTAFENLDLDAFMACFAPDATVFFPSPEPPQRFNGKEAIRDHFLRVFSSIRKSSTATKPPFHRLKPEDMHIQLVGSDVAVVTFHLRNSDRIARRTLVVSKVADSWLIMHLHASNVPVAPRPDTVQH